MIDQKIFLEAMEEQGCCLVPNVLTAEFRDKLKDELEKAIEEEVNYHRTREYNDYGMVMLCALYGGAFIELFDNERLICGINNILGEGCIVYAYISTSMPPGKSNYSKRIHVDCPRNIPGYCTNTGVIVLLDDFTEENGATWYLPGSHRDVEKPSEDYFYANAKRLIAKSGSAFYINPLLWHAGGTNNTDHWRHAVTMNICHPWMKQRVDIPRAMSHIDTTRYSEVTLQKLGFYAQVPASYDEYYVPLEQRKFKQKVE